MSFRIYTVEIHGYPQQFTIPAKDRGEAILEAQKRWHSQMNGASIYETEVTAEEALEKDDTCILCDSGEPHEH